MRFTCLQKTLATSISTVLKAVNPRSTHPILEGILIKAQKGVLILTGNDLELGIESFLEADIKEEGSVVVPARIFNDIIRKLPNMDIEISVDENHIVKINTKGSNYEISGMNPEEYPEIKDIPENDPIEIEKKLLKDMINNTVFAVATDETRPILTGALLEIKNDEMSMVCLDGYRLALRKSRTLNIKEEDILIPGKALNEISNILEDDDEKLNVIIDDRHILFDLGYTRITSRLLSGEFINYDQIIPKDYNTRVKVKVRDLYNAIERASLLAREGKNNLIKLTIGESKIIINSNSEIGTAHEEVDIEMVGKDLIIAFNARYFMDILKVIEDEEAYIEFTSNIGPSIFKPIDDDAYTYLLLPVRINI